MSSNKECVSSLAVIHSFSWSFEQVKSQHDIHEFSRGFLEDLKNEIKNHDGDYSFFDKFYGRMRNIISFKHSEPIYGEDDFSDLSLAVERSNSIEQGIQEYIDGSEMSGKNQYEFPDGTKVDAKVTYSFVKLPEILHIQLNRFKFDPIFKKPSKITKPIQCPCTLR